MRRTPVSLILLLTLSPALHAEVLNRVVLRINYRIATLRDYQQRRQEMVREILRREQDPEDRQRLIGFDPAEQPEVESLIARAADAAQMFAAESIEKAMNVYNPDAAGPEVD